MVKAFIRGTTIEIWEEDYINDLVREEPLRCYISPKDRDAEIIQIEHAYDNKFMVEVRRKNNGKTITS